jgi:hypothetical protein
MGGATIMTNFLLLCALAYQQFLGSGVPWLAAAAYVVFLGFLAFRGRRLKLRAADLLSVAARRAGLGRVLPQNPA